MNTLLHANTFKSKNESHATVGKHYETFTSSILLSRLLVHIINVFVAVKLNNNHNRLGFHERLKDDQIMKNVDGINGAIVVSFL
jgi:hypothetical protein